MYFYTVFSPTIAKFKHTEYVIQFSFIYMAPNHTFYTNY